MASTINASNSGFGGIVSTGDSSGQLQLQTANTTAVTIDTSQNVGIGTTSPNGKFESYANSGYSVIANSSAGSVAINPSSNAIVFGTTNVAAYATGNYDAATHVYKTSGTERMRIDSSGNVLVGTTTAPSAGAKFNALGGTQTSDSTGNVQKITRCFIHTFAATGTKNIQFTVADSCAYAIEVTMTSTYAAANYGGAMKTVFGGSMNNSSTTLYGSGQTAMYSVGLMSTAYAFGTQTKPSNTALNIPITFSGTPSSPVYIVVELYGTVNGITNIAIV